MKYLKKFNEAINNDDLRDICLELKDLGFDQIDIKHHFNYDYNYIFCKRTSDYPEDLNDVLWKDIKDCILRLIDYLGDRFIDFTYGCYIDGDHKSITITEPLNDDDDNYVGMFSIDSVFIKYKD